MSYVLETMSDSESILYEAKFHWVYTFSAYLILLLSGWMLIGVVVFFRMMINKWTSEITLTDQRLVYKTGWIKRNTQEVALNRLEEINLNQGFLGRVFDYGKLNIHGTGVGLIDLPDIDSPLKFRIAIGNAKSNFKKLNEG